MSIGDMGLLDFAWMGIKFVFTHPIGWIFLGLLILGWLKKKFD